MRLHCVQRASISTQVISSTFTRGSTFVCRYYSLWGDIAMPGGLYAGLCNTFLVTKTKLFLLCSRHRQHRKQVHSYACLVEAWSVCLPVCVVAWMTLQKRLNRSRYRSGGRLVSACGLTKLLSDWVYMDATWRIRLNDLCSAATWAVATVTEATCLLSLHASTR